MVERELHEHMMTVERELIAAELARYDVTAEEVQVDGKIYRQALTSTETYLSAAGPVKVERHLYRPAERSSKSICPLELRAGIVGGFFTPRAARQGAFALAHLTPRDAVALFAEIGGMTPSRSSLDRLPKELSSRWEVQRTAWEAALRIAEHVPPEAVVLSVSLDGVMAPMKNAGRAEKRAQADKQAMGPAGYREVGCGTVSLHDGQGQRLATVRYGRMPEHELLNESWHVDKRLRGKYVWATIVTHEQRLHIYYRKSEQHPAQQRKTARYTIDEPVRPLRSEYRRRSRRRKLSAML